LTSFDLIKPAVEDGAGRNGRNFCDYPRVRRDEESPMESQHRPRLLITLGDVAGIGPEVLVKAWASLFDWCRPVVVGDPAWIRRAFAHTSANLDVIPVRCVTDLEPTPQRIVCLNGSDQDLTAVTPGAVSTAAGRAAYDYLCTAIDLVLAKEADGIVTLPLHKEGLHAARVPFPGHTEILADRTGSATSA
jgi:4-hydroxy-L-threonine phosphate dehydrogenase PdxA